MNQTLDHHQEPKPEDTPDPQRRSGEPCHYCGSRRTTKYRATAPFMNYRIRCRKCNALYELRVVPVTPAVCYRCNHPIVDPAKEVAMGNGKKKHSRCRAPKGGGGS